jgi:polar amino acid transport system substrate-binding protein
MKTLTRRTTRSVQAVGAIVLLATIAAACGSSSSGNATTTAAGNANATTTTAAASTSGAGTLNLTANQNRIVPAKVDAIAAEVPDAIKKAGKLIIGVGASGAGFPPLAFAADDNKTLIGSEPDIAVLVAGVLGLTPDIQNTSWENLFIGLDAGTYDVAFSNVTDTELRKQKYDFASYRQDNLAFEVAKDANWTFTKAEDLAGKTIAVGSGTNQEKILLAYGDVVKKAGLKPITVKYFQDNNSQYLALSSGQIDGVFGPNPSLAYHVSTGGETKIVGTVSGAGATLQGLIAATTKKDNGLVKALTDALNYVIKSGDYSKVLQRWNLSNEAVSESLTNPPGLPLTNS